MIQHFGTMPDGREVVRVPLRCGKISAEIVSYGASLGKLCVPGRDGQSVDVVLGFDTCENLLAHTAHYGAVVGRFANRIAGGSFLLCGKRCEVSRNRGANHLHGGATGFSHQLWSVSEHSDSSVTLTLTSPDGHEGYPGTMTAWVTYTLTEDALRLDYRAVSDADTLCNLTNHAYFNLDGHDSGSVENQTVQLFADAYTPADKDSIPTGELAPVDGTPLDLRQPTRLGSHWDDDFDQLRWAGGYDQNFVIRGADGTLRPAAEARAARTGVVLRVETDLPGVQLYTGNGIKDTTPPGKGGVRYARRCAFCLETQLFPDAPNHANFPSAVLRAGETFRSSTVFRFGTF